MRCLISLLPTGAAGRASKGQCIATLSIVDDEGWGSIAMLAHLVRLFITSSKGEHGF